MFYLVAHNKNVEVNTQVYMKSLLDVTFTSSIVSRSEDATKSFIKPLSSCTVYITKCKLLPWTIPNLTLIVELFKQKKVSITYLDIRVDMTKDIHANPANQFLSYLKAVNK